MSLIGLRPLFHYTFWFYPEFLSKRVEKYDNVEYINKTMKQSKLSHHCVCFNPSIEVPVKLQTSLLLITLHVHYY